MEEAQFPKVGYVLGLGRGKLEEARKPEENLSSTMTTSCTQSMIFLF